MARAAGDPAALAYALAAHCDAIAGPADAEQRLRESTEIVELALAGGDRATELLGRRLRVVALFELGDIDGVDAEIEAYARLAELDPPAALRLVRAVVASNAGAHARRPGRVRPGLARTPAPSAPKPSSENAAILYEALMFVRAPRGRQHGPSPPRSAGSSSTSTSSARRCASPSR